MQPILIPLDGSALAEAVFPIGRTLAQRTGAPVRLVHVRHPLQPLYVEGLPVVDKQLRPLHGLHEQSYMEQARQRFRGDMTVEVVVDVLDGPTASALATHAATTNSALIVMTTHGYGGFERFWLGSVADTLVRIAGVPILLYRPHGENGPEAKPLEGRPILVPLDGSPLSEQILPHVSWLAHAFNAPITLLRVLPLDATHADAPDPLGDSPLAEAERYLQQVRLGLEEQGCRTRTHLMSHEQPARALLGVATRDNVGIIAMATHGRGDMQRLILGSVSDKVLRSADVPLMLYRPQAD